MWRRGCSGIFFPGSSGIFKKIATSEIDKTWVFYGVFQAKKNCFLRHFGHVCACTSKLSAILERPSICKFYQKYPKNPLKVAIKIGLNLDGKDTCQILQ